jgi:hypothetical protein
MAEKQKYDVFLSYNMQDRSWVTEFSSALRSAGVTRWFDAHELKAGERWQEAIEGALRDSRVLVLVITPNSFSRPWTFFELGAAVAGHKRIIPVISGDVDLNSLPALVRKFQFVKESSPVEAAKRVAEAIPEGVEA